MTNDIQAMIMVAEEAAPGSVFYKHSKEDLDKLIGRVQNHPHSYTGQTTDKEFIADRELLTEVLLDKDEKYSENIYVTPASPAMQQELIDAVASNSPFVNMMRAGIIEVHKRAAMEYNPQYIQIIPVGLFKTLDNRVVILRTKADGNTRIKDKLTLPQGHSEFRTEHTLKDSSVVLLSELLREFKEEVKVDNSPELEIVHYELLNAILTSDSVISLEHIGFLYEVTLGVNSIELMEKFNIRSGEPDKHEVILLDPKELYKQKDLADSWLQAVIENNL